MDRPVWDPKTPYHQYEREMVAWEQLGHDELIRMRTTRPRISQNTQAHVYAKLSDDERSQVPSAIENLASVQYQADEGGAMVTVSREALSIVLNWIHEKDLAQ